MRVKHILFGRGKNFNYSNKFNSNILVICCLFCLGLKLRQILLVRLNFTFHMRFVNPQKQAACFTTLAIL